MIFIKSGKAGYRSGYGHTWDYWDLKVQDFLKWLVGQNMHRKA
ncbi:MAG: hypothetical protein PF518_06440 [Spirochaetaceae bacterium]|nr:hypothetical protein [Spirochaetaceae bacterium]